MTDRYLLWQMKNGKWCGAHGGYGRVRFPVVVMYNDATLSSSKVCIRRLERYETRARQRVPRVL